MLKAHSLAGNSLFIELLQIVFRARRDSRGYTLREGFVIAVDGERAKRIRGAPARPVGDDIHQERDRSFSAEHSYRKKHRTRQGRAGEAAVEPRREKLEGALAAGRAEREHGGLRNGVVARVEIALDEGKRSLGREHEQGF